MISHITYISDDKKVKGYISVPGGFPLSRQRLEHRLHQFYKTSGLPVTQLTCSIKRNNHQPRLPALIYCRGGIGKVGKVKLDWIEQFASFGYIVFAPSYRGNEGGTGRDEFGGAENEDVLSAYRFLASLPFVDEERISVMGFSRGAINAALTTVSIPDIHRLILWGGVSDLAQTYEERIDLRKMLKRVIGGSPAKVPDAYKARSPVHMAEHIRCPVLIMHGTDDLQVDFSHGLHMYDTLTKLGANADMHCYDGYGHHLPRSVHDEALRQMFAWIERMNG